MTKEDLEQIRLLMKEEISPINQRLDKIEGRLDNIEVRMDKFEGQISVVQKDITGLKDDVSGLKDDVEEIKEDGKITRIATNELVKWAEAHSDKDDPFPIEKQAI